MNLRIDIAANPISVIFHGFVGVGFELKNKLDIVVYVARCNVQMEVEHRLAGDSAVVGEEIESVKIQRLDDCAGHHLCGVEYMMKVFFRNMKKIDAMCLRNDKGMSVMNGVYVENADDPLVLIENLCR